jgi:hypothetical protein
VFPETTTAKRFWQYRQLVLQLKGRFQHWKE